MPAPPSGMNLIRTLSGKRSPALRKLKRRAVINTRRLLYPVLYRRAVPTANIYHCCIQKTATQWFSRLLNDGLIWKRTGYSLYYPGENFITDDRAVLARLRDIPRAGVICSPLYIRRHDFAELTRGRDFRAFYILRDPRDIIVSNYFSIRFSHPSIKEYIDRKRREMEGLSEHDGILRMIDETAEFFSRIMHDWRQARMDGLRVFRFEDVFGPEQPRFLGELFDHCGLSLPAADLAYLAEQYSFSRISGRKPGAENRRHHYRKGVSGDWRNYFSADHKRVFKERAGGLLIGLGYEADMNW